MNKTMTVAVVAALMTVWMSGCATKVDEDAMRSDWRTGTDYSPYRSIAPAVLCDDCRYEK